MQVLGPLVSPVVTAAFKGGGHTFRRQCLAAIRVLRRWGVVLVPPISMKAVRYRWLAFYAFVIGNTSCTCVVGNASQGMPNSIGTSKRHTH